MDTVELNTLIEMEVKNKFRELLNELVKEYEKISFNRAITKWEIYRSNGDFVRILQNGANDYIVYTAQLSLLNNIINMIANKTDNIFILDDTDKIYQINETESVQYRVLRVVETEKRG